MRSLAGFTLVELMVAFSILTIAVLGLLSVAVRVSHIVTEGRYYSHVAAVAFGQLEQLRPTGCGDAITGELDTGKELLNWFSAGNHEMGPWNAVVVEGRTILGTHADTLTTASQC